ncbi:MAG: hypothetical protein NT121_00110 [Chloroflexi bacterium]|nr:hypothetical protein [Chloroflexota bacterium]
MINSVSSQNQMLSLQSTSKPARATGAASTSAKLSVDSPGKESSEPISEEMKETIVQKSAEALRTLVSQESTQRQSAAPKNIVNIQTALAAYQQ